MKNLPPISVLGTISIALLALIHLTICEVSITQTDGVPTLWYNSSNTHVATYILDYFMFPEIADDKYYIQQRRKSGMSETMYICVTDEWWMEISYHGSNCDYWESVGWNTGADWKYGPSFAKNRWSKYGVPLLSRLSIHKMDEGPNSYRFRLNIVNPSRSDNETYVLGIWWQAGYYSARQRFYLWDMYKNPKYQPKIAPQNKPLKPHIATSKDMVAITNPTFEDTLAIETGFSDINFWLEWMKYSANKHNKSNCYVCGKSRPHLGTVPLNIPLEQENCFFSLFNDTKTNDSQCEMWKREYPILSKNPNPRSTITIYPGNYTCYTSNITPGRNLKTFPPGYCANKRTTVLVNQTRSLGDIYYICGDMKLRTKLDTPWYGECALAKVIMPLLMITDDPNPPSNTPANRKKRALPGGSFDPHVYIDAIGVPRGVPNEFKARDEVAAGFESLFPIVTVNKNVAWINYIYYNQQRFVNDTKDALKGIAEQLEATSQMTFQNRMALDMILAEKGGTCVYISKVEGCCTYIPDNTGPNGKVTLAINKLETLSIELKKNSGIDNPWSQYFGWFENWKQALVQISIFILVTLILLGIIVYCVIPCGKKLTSKGIDKALMYYDITPSPVTSSDSKGPDDYAQYLKNWRNKKGASLKNHVI
ncbi:sodium/potassium-transporting ATPase subunit beta-1-interacting protein 3 isoform X1 [Pseudophryne corroboree]|uniref:sodium/potassium-transporting ATPase subunit beta-1-interacting protein 3 isoform X1 n=1 Tax=Pseudophryne corroboree TaxID=495146 RepID=UPI0030816450